MSPGILAVACSGTEKPVTSLFEARAKIRQQKQKAVFGTFGTYGLHPCNGYEGQHREIKF